VPADVESARLEWEEAFRRYERELRDPQQAARLRPQFAVLRDELRKRVGSTFTLNQLAAEYREAERWVRDAVSERAASAGWPRTLTLVEGAAFHSYARGAVDYEP
jgi:hypothetical protein